MDIIDSLIAKKIVGGGGGGGDSTISLGLRPDAEKVFSKHVDRLAAEDDGVSLPAYTTSQKAILASTTLDDIITTDFNLYDYIILTRCLVIPVYNSNQIVKGRQEYCIQNFTTEITNYPKGTFKAISTDDIARWLTRAAENIRRVDTYTTVEDWRVYWATESDLRVYESAVGGCYAIRPIHALPTADQSTISLKTPAINIRGNDTYFSSAAWSMLTDVRYQYIIDVYRIPRDKSIKGWALGSAISNIAENVRSGLK